MNGQKRHSLGVPYIIIYHDNLSSGNLYPDFLCCRRSD